MSTRHSDIRRESDLLWLEDATDSEATITARGIFAKSVIDKQVTLKEKSE